MQTNRLLEHGRNELKKVIVGQEELLNQCLLTILCGGHALLEGVPGIAKTLVIKCFARLFELEGLQKLDAEFLARVRARDPSLHRRLLHYRETGGALAPTEVSELLITCAPMLEQMLAELFGIEDAVARSRRETMAHDPVFVFKKQ